MTANQIARLNYLENSRSNQAREFETHRSNLANEAEKKRSNLASETETRRANLARENETSRHNRISESTEAVKTAGQVVFGKGGIAGTIKLFR